MMERVLSVDNLRAAVLKVKANKGAPGIDHITTEQLEDHLREHWSKLKTKIMEGTYRPSPVRPKEISTQKANAALTGSLKALSDG